MVGGTLFQFVTVIVMICAQIQARVRLDGVRNILAVIRVQAETPRSMLI